jgi:hypothetical protein
MKDFLTSKVIKLMSSFAIVKHLSRQKCATALVLSLIRTRQVQFQELALVFNDQVKEDSNERRIQAFFKEAYLDEDQLVFVLSLFLVFGKVDLCLDRTEWDFGKCQINLLVLSAYCQGVGLPLYVEFLDNHSGNSACKDRVEMLQKVISLLGKKRIGSVIADREFIGKDWIEYLLKEGLAFFLRVPKHYLFRVNGRELKAENLLQSRSECRLDNISVLGITGLSVGMKKIKDKQGKEFYLIVLTNTFAYQAVRSYKRRWSIEVMFQDFKSQGFNLESSHLKQAYKIKKLVYLVSLAYAFCLHVGLYYEKYIAPITKKKHGYRSKSLFRTGLDRLRSMFQRKKPDDFLFWQILIEAFVHLSMIKILAIKKL